MALHPEKILGLGFVVLAASTAAMVVSILVAYPLAQFFSLGSQVIAHIVMMVAAIPMKFGYVACLAGGRGMGLTV